MGQVGGRSAGWGARIVAWALFHLLTASPALAQERHAVAGGSVTIEQPVGGSFALLASNEALTAVFRPPGPEISAPARDRTRTGTAAYSAYIGSAAERIVVNTGDPIEVSVHFLSLYGMKYGQNLVLASPMRPPVRAQAILVLVNFN